MLFSFIPSLPLGWFKLTTVVVVATALVHQIYFALNYYPLMRMSSSSTSSVQMKQQPPNATTVAADSSAKEATFGACLLVKDDNDLLYEWLAYHYTVLPLRHLVIGVDVNSTQHPGEVLERWRQNNSTQDLQYWVLEADEFRHRYEDTDGTKTTAQRNQQNGETEKERQHHALIRRQKGFIATCSEILQRHGVHWTAYIDTDEFVVPNVLATQQQFGSSIDDDDDDSAIRNDSLHIRNQLRSIGDWKNGEYNNNTTTVAQILLELQRRTTEAARGSDDTDASNYAAVDACYTMPRLIIGALENRTCPDSQDTREYAQKLLQHETGQDDVVSTTRLALDRISTLRFAQHAKKGDFAQNKFGKVVMDLSRINETTISHQVPRNIHRPYREHCGPGVGIPFPQAAFYLAHYIGSWERYSARPDGRRNRAEWEQRAYFDHGLVCETGVHQWLPRFVATVGERPARYLLGG